MKRTGLRLRRVFSGFAAIGLLLLPVVREGRPASAFFTPPARDLETASASKAAIRTMQMPGEAAAVRHAPIINGGRIEGSVRVLSAESVTLNSGSAITSDLLVPGTPSLIVNGQATYNGTVEGTGAAQPSSHRIILNSAVMLRHIVNRTDPATLDPVPLPPSPTGNRDVSINQPGQSVGDFTTLRNLTLNSNAGAIAVPPGTYGNFTANVNSAFVFGAADSAQPLVYNLQNLTLNSTSELRLLGPVAINVANQVTIQSRSVMGKAEIPLWLTLNVSRFGVVINSIDAALYGAVRAPSGTVVINSRGLLKGLVQCDRLTINSGGIIQGLTPDSTAPAVTITEPAEGAVISQTQTTVKGTVIDDSAVRVTVNGVVAAVNGEEFSAVVPLVQGANTLRAIAADAFGQVGEATRAVTQSNAPNQPPAVNAGPDQTITLPNSASLNGTAADDGKPTGSALAVMWSKLSGPGTVTFSNQNSAVTTASFSASGAYALRLTASDSQLSGFDDVNVTVNSADPVNQPPVVNAGPDQTIALPNTAALNGSATDDGLPAGGTLSIVWSKASGPGAVVFSNPNSASTTASFSAAGAYLLRFTANDSQLSSSDDVSVTVNAAAANQPPIVNAGTDQTITLPNKASLNATATDDGLPSAVLALVWSQVSGPGTVAFSNPDQASTMADFSENGVYVLRLAANDSLLSSSDEITVNVNPQQLLVVYSTQSGFIPDEETTKAGLTTIMIRNRSGTDNLAYAITQGSASSSVTVPLGKNGFVNVALEAGEAFITEASHPEWRCRIIVAP